MTSKRKFTQAKDAYLRALAYYTTSKQAIADQDIQFCKDNGYHYPMWQIEDEAIFTEATSKFQIVLDATGLQDLANEAYDHYVTTKRAFIEVSIDLMPKRYQTEKESLLKGSAINSTLAQKLLDIALQLNTETIPT